MCWFALVRNMWGFLAASLAPITANENLSNKPYFCLGLLSILAYILRPFDSRSVILGIFIIFVPHNMASHWACWMIVEQNKLLVNLMCFELPQKMDV